MAGRQRKGDKVYMPYCYYCGAELYLVLPYMKVNECYCEKCMNYSKVLPGGKINEKELERAQRDFQKEYYENMGPGLSYREVVSRMLARQGKKYYRVRMFNPMERDREHKLICASEYKKEAVE